MQSYQAPILVALSPDLVQASCTPSPHPCPPPNFYFQPLGTCLENPNAGAPVDNTVAYVLACGPIECYY